MKSAIGERPSASEHSENRLLIQQLFEAETCTYTYLLADSVTKDAVLIDPVLEKVDRDLKLVSELGLTLRWVLDTHVHADHVTGAGEIRKRTGASSAISKAAGVDCIDRTLVDGDEIAFGELRLRALETPGHTQTCMCFFIQDIGTGSRSGYVFTGDVLLIRGCGRTDFQGGSSHALYASVHRKLFTLPPQTVVFPGHDYKGFTSSTIGDEMRCNPRLGTSVGEEAFVKIMSELKLSEPKRMHEAVPRNLACGSVVVSQAATSES